MKKTKKNQKYTPSPPGIYDGQVTRHLGTQPGNTALTLIL